MVTVINKDCISALKEMSDESVDCCITSPPYYALRDYGTGRWEGGDENCDHVADCTKTKRFGNDEFNRNRPCRDATKTAGYYKSVCPKCGAIRIDDQIGLEETPEEYIAKLTEVFHEVKRVLKKNGTLWLNIGDSYWGSGSRGYDFTGKYTEASKVQQGSKGTINLSNVPKLVGNTNGIKNKDLIGIPWMLAFSLRADGWYLRQDIIWHKPNPMPESVTDRCVRSHEYVFLLSKSKDYFFDYESIQENSAYDTTVGKPTGITFGGKKYGGTTQEFPDGKSTIYSGNEWTSNGKRRKRDVWSVCPSTYKGAHFATFPEKLIEPCILAGCAGGGTVLDPFGGSGTTGVVANRLGRNAILIELNKEYAQMCVERTGQITFDDI